MNKLTQNPFERKQKGKVAALYIVCIACTLLFAAASCGKSNTEERPQEELPPDDFYYYFGEKRFLDQLKDKIYISFTSDANEEQLLAIINSDASLQPMQSSFDPIRLEGLVRRAVLETKDGQQIPPATIQKFKAKNEVVFVSYLNRTSGSFTAFTNRFVVKLLETTSYAQLQELAEKYHCTVEQNPYDRFFLTVSKASRLNGLQTANLFYETGLFEYCAPRSVGINPNRFVH